MEACFEYSSGQKSISFLDPSPGTEGDYIFLDGHDTDGDGLTDGYEDWFTYTPGNGVISACAPRSQRLTCADRVYSTESFLKDSWKVANGLNPMDNGGSSNPNDPAYKVPGDTRDSQTKHDDYLAKLEGGQPGLADDDAKNITGSSGVRPVIVLSQSPPNAFGQATFTITRDVGSGTTPTDLVVYLCARRNADLWPGLHP